MAKQIRRQDVVEDDIFKVTRESAQETLVVLDKLNAEFKESAKVLKEDISKATLESAKSIETFVKSTEKATKLKNDSIKVDEQTIKIKQQLARLEEMEEKRRLAKEKADGQAIANSQKLQREEERKAKATERAAKAAKDEASAYKQLEKNTRELKNQSKELAAQMLLLERNGQKNTKQYRELSAEYKKVTAAAQQGDQALKKIDSTVGDNFRNVGNYKSALGGLKNMLGQLGLAFGIGTVVRNAFSAIKDFDQGMANLASVLGKSRSEIVALEEDAKRLGGTTRFTASEVAQLQTEFAKLGFNQNEILNATESTLALAGATGTELGRAAEVAGATLRGFGLDASEMQRVNDVMAKSFSTSALDMEKFAESMKYVAPVAKAAGVSLEEATAMLGKLADSGIRGSQAGTSLRRILTDMAATGKPAQEALKEIADRGISLTDAMDEVGRSAQTSLLVLSKNQKGVETLTETYKNAKGAAKEMADTQLNTLAGSIDLLTSALESQILGLDDASRSSERFRSVVTFLAENMGTIVSILGRVLAAWAAYRALQVSLIAIEKLRNFNLAAFGKTLAAQIPLTKAYKQAQKEAAIATENGGKAAAGAGKAMSAIPWVAIIGLAIELASAFIDVASGAARAREQAERLDNYRAKASETAQKNITKETEALDKQLKQRQRDLQVAQSQAKTEAEKQRLEKENAALRKQDIDNAQKQVKSYRDAAVVRLKSYRAEKAELEELTSIRFGNRTEAQQNRINQIYEELGVTSWSAMEKMKDAQDILNAKITAAGTKITDYNKGLETMNEMLLDSSTELEVLNNAETKETKTKEKKTKVQKELNTTMAEYNEYLTVQTELLNELEQLQTEGKINALNTEISNLTEELQMLAEGGADINTDVIEAKIQQRYALEKALIKQKLDAEIAAINERYRLDALKARQTVDKEYQKLINQQGLSPEERLKIETQYQDQLRLLEQDELQRNADKELQLKILNEKANQEQIDLEQKTNDEIIDLKNDLNDRILQSEQSRIDKEDENRQKELEKEKKNAEQRIAIVNAIADAAIAASQRRVEQIEKEIAAAESQADYFKELAAQGNIDAKQSLAEQNKIIAEANQKKEAELRKQQRIQFANTVYQTYQKNSSDENVKNPLAKTITDVTLLAEFIKNFPAFLEGTEDTGTNGQGVDGKGGFHAILHPNERVMTKEQNAMVGDLSNESLAKLAQEYNAGSVITKAEGAVQLGGAWSTAAVIKKLDELEQALKSKPETNIELGEIIDGAMTIVKTKKQGNSVVYNRYKVK